MTDRTVYLVRDADGTPRGYSEHRDNAERCARWVEYRHILPAVIEEVPESEAKALFEAVK